MNNGTTIEISRGPAQQANSGTRPSHPTAAEQAVPAAQPALHAPAVFGRFAAVALGGLSLALYALLFSFDEELVELARSTHRGDKRFFFVPIAIALLFSFVHGAFTGRFWDALGLKARS